MNFTPLDVAFRIRHKLKKRSKKRLFRSLFSENIIRSFLGHASWYSLWSYVLVYVSLGFYVFFKTACNANNFKFPCSIDFTRLSTLSTVDSRFHRDESWVIRWIHWNSMFWFRCSRFSSKSCLFVLSTTKGGFPVRVLMCQQFLILEYFSFHGPFEMHSSVAGSMKRGSHSRSV